MNTLEEFVPLKRNERYYISKFGRIYCTKNKKLISWHMHKSKGNIYPRVVLDDRKKYFVHTLVAEQFLEKKNEKDVVNHKDYNTFNFNVTNLEWITQKENVLHGKRKISITALPTTNT